MIGLVVGNGQVKNRRLFAFFGISEFEDIDVARLTVLIRRIVGDVNTLTMVSFCVPVIEKSKDVVLGNSIEKATDSRVTVHAHVLCKKRMIECVIWVVLTGVIFVNNQVGK